MPNQETITCKNNFGETVTLPKKKFEFRPSVYAIIRHNDKICVCKNKSNGKYWLPGGGVEKGEPRIDALMREIDEETGLKHVEIERLIDSYENFFFYQPTDEAMHAFLFFYAGSSEETDCKTGDLIDDEEVTDWEWKTFEEIQDISFSSLDDEIHKMIAGLKT